MSPGIWLSQLVVLPLLVMVLYTQCWDNNRCVYVCGHTGAEYDTFLRILAKT